MYFKLAILWLLEMVWINSNGTKMNLLTGIVYFSIINFFMSVKLGKCAD